MMSNEVKRKKPVEVPEESGETVKKSKLEESLPNKLALNSNLSNADVLKELKDNWGKSVFDCPEKGIRLSHEPFPHAEIENILLDADLLKSLKTSLKYTEKTSDLFHFHQSCDLSSVGEDFEGYEAVLQISEFFKTDLLDAMKSVTQLPLNGKFDIFASEYKQTDHLLCHDDELDSRRIAFIIYMSEDWSSDYGGTLDLFDCIEDDNGPSPGKVVKSIVPQFNKLVFFEVTAKSFHQVSEVVRKNGSRLAISGWFYGDPLPRPETHLPAEIFYSVDFPDRKNVSLGEYLDASYMIEETVKTANDQLSENSEIMLSSFLKPDVYDSLLEKLESSDTSKWEKCGPANLQHYYQLPENVPGFPHELKQLFTSKTFLEFLQELTEFPFASEPELRFTYSLKKFSQASYTLIRGKERSYRPRDFVPLDSADESSDAEDAVEEDKPEEDHAGDENVSPEPSAQPSRTGNGIHHSDDEEDIGDEEQEEEIMADSPEGYEIVEDEEPEEPNRVDVILFLVPQAKSASNGSSVTNGDSKDIDAVSGNWEESWGGNRIYTDDLTGNQLINIIPSGNALAIVVRDESISSHYSYVNSLAGKSAFYCYDFEFNFPRAK